MLGHDDDNCRKANSYSLMFMKRLTSMPLVRHHNNQQMIIYFLLCCCARIFLKIFFRIQVDGIRNIPRKGTFIIAPNHISFLDPVAAGAFVPRNLYYMARDTLFDIPLLGALIKTLRQISPICIRKKRRRLHGAINPDKADTRSNLGWAYIRKDMLNEAITELKKALDIDPNYAKVHRNLAIAYYKKGEFKSAIKHCDIAVEFGYKIHPKFLEDLEPYRTKI